MCVSHECLPSQNWACPECIGQKTYDDQLSQRIKVSRERWIAGKMSMKERDGYSQLVFDLLCSCAWSEWKVNVEALIEDNKARLARDPSYLPTMLPFHSLHYPLAKEDMTKISQAYAKAAETKAVRAYRITETRNRCAEEEEEAQRKKYEDRSRSADDRSAGGDSRDSPVPGLVPGAQVSSRRVLARLREGAVVEKGGEREREAAGVPLGYDMLKTVERLHGMASAGNGASESEMGICGRASTVASQQKDIETDVANKGEVALATACVQGLGASLSGIAMWKPELCSRARRGGEGSSRERLRIGYMSSDFVNHPTADLIIRALLLHDGDEFETFCYSLAKVSSYFCFLI